MGESKRRRLGADAWRGLLARYVGSGLSVQAFCRRESVSASSFYRWRELLGANLAGAAGTGSAAACSLQSRDAADFIDLGVLSPVNTSASTRLEFKLDLGGGVLLQVVRS